VALSISIEPTGDGWTLKSAPLGLDLVFATGGQAEANGRKLASHLARSGQAVELEIILRDGVVAAVIPFAPSAAA
jgi:hypothetical protein